MSYVVTELDAALFALEIKIFAGDSVSVENDEFLAEALSHWSASERRSTLAALIKRYGTPNIGTDIVHALARLICRDVELKLSSTFGCADHRYGER